MKGGASTRDRMLVLFALSVGLALVALSLWILNQRIYWLLIGVIGLVLGLIYPLAIRWIDRNGEWPQ